MSDPQPLPQITEGRPKVVAVLKRWRYRIFTRFKELWHAAVFLLFITTSILLMPFAPFVEERLPFSTNYFSVEPTPEVLNSFYGLKANIERKIAPKSKIELIFHFTGPKTEVPDLEWIEVSVVTDVKPLNADGKLEPIRFSRAEGRWRSRQEVVAVEVFSGSDHDSDFEWTFLVATNLGFQETKTIPVDLVTFSSYKWLYFLWLGSIGMWTLLSVGPLLLRLVELLASSS